MSSFFLSFLVLSYQSHLIYIPFKKLSIPLLALYDLKLSTVHTLTAATTNGLTKQTHKAKSIFDERWMMTQKKKKEKKAMWLWSGKECYIPLLALCRLVRKWSQIKKNCTVLTFSRNWYYCVSFYNSITARHSAFSVPSNRCYFHFDILEI